MNVALQYTRRKLVDAGLMPQSRLAYFALLMLGIELLLVVVQWLLLRSGGQPALAGWIAILTFVNFVLFSILAVRWLRNVLMWRLRNRLIVTYLFIGVIPVALIASIVLLGGYLMTAQFAVFLASYDIHEEADTLLAANADLAGRLADAARHGTPLSQPGILEQELEVLRKDFPKLEVTAMLRGETTALGTKGPVGTARLPGWVKGQYAGLVSQTDKSLYLTTVTSAPVGRDALVVWASVPVDATELSRIGRNLGEISLTAGQIVSNNPDNQGSGLTVKTPERGGVNFEVGDKSTKQHTHYDLNNPEGTVQGGKVPRAIGVLDREVRFPSPVPTLN